MASHDVGNISLREKRFQKRNFLICRGKVQHQRDPAIEHVLVPAILLRAGIDRHEFPEAQRVHVHLIAAAAKFCDHILRKETRIAPGHIDIHILSAYQTIQHIFKFSEHLHFIKKHIVHPLLPDLFLQVRK